MGWEEKERSEVVHEKHGNEARRSVRCPSRFDGPCLVLPMFGHAIQGGFGPAGKEGWGLSFPSIRSSSVSH